MFEVGKPVTGANFFDRTQQKKNLQTFMRNKTNVMISAPRRYGKTSLVKEILGDSEYIYLDFMKRANFRLMAEDLLNGAYAMEGLVAFVDKAKYHVTELFASHDIKGSLSIGDISLGIELVKSSEKDDCTVFLEALEIAERLAKKKQKCITIVFDEFQEIVNLECKGDILKMLRSQLQDAEHIHSVFLGSIESVMNHIFSNRNSPFYNYCRKMELKPFDMKELSQQLVEILLSKGIVFDSIDDFEKFLDKLGGHPANTMLAVQILYYRMIEKGTVALVKQDDMSHAYEDAFYERKDAVIQMIMRAKTKKHYQDVLYHMANGTEADIDSQTLYKARRGLVDMGLVVHRDRDDYCIADNFLVEYLKEKTQ